LPPLGADAERVVTGEKKPLALVAEIPILLKHIDLL
jgi:hypothetical protein